MALRIGLIGAGNVGGGMARKLRDASIDLIVYDKSDAALERLASTGAEFGSSPADVARRVDIVLLSLPNSNIVDAVVLGEDGVLEGLPAGKLLVDMSSSLPTRTLALVKECERRGIRMIDAPISFGGGGMVIMVGGPEEWFEEAKPYFDIVGTKATWVGPHSHGHVTKLVQNMISGVGIAIVAEMLAFATKAGVDPDRMVDAIGSAGGASGQLARGVTRMTAHDFGTGGQLALHYKDVKYAIETAMAMDMVTPMTSALYQVFNGAHMTGDKLWAQVGCITYWEQINGVRVGEESTTSVAD